MKRFAIALLFIATPSFADVNVIDNDKTITVDCAKDKKVMIVGNGAKITMNGTCEHLMISGNDAKVTGSAANVMVSGNSSKLDLDATLADSFPWVTTTEIDDDIETSAGLAIAAWQDTPVARLGAAMS